MFDKDKEKSITQEIIDKLLYDQEKINLPNIIFYYWSRALKDHFNSKRKEKPIPYCMYFTQIMKNIRVDMSTFAPFEGLNQFTSSTFIKMGIVEIFLDWTKHHIKRKVKKEPQSIEECRRI